MAIDAPSLSDSVAPRAPDAILPALGAVVVATIAVGLWMMGAPAVAVAGSSALVAALLWLRTCVGPRPS